MAGYIIIATLIANINAQTTTPTFATEEFTSNTSKYVVTVGNTAFNWFEGRDLCIQKGYVMAQINTTIQHQQIADIIISSQVPITTCWLGAFGFFITNTSIIWTWDAFDRNIPWNQSFVSQLMVEPRFAVDVDPKKMQGLIITNNGRNNDALWSYGNADLFQNGANGRRCVACLDIINITTATSTSPSSSPTPDPTISPSNLPTQSPSNLPSFHPSLIPTHDPTFHPSIIPTVIPTDIPSSSPSIRPSISPSFHPSVSPTQFPTAKPSRTPSFIPTYKPSTTTPIPTIKPSFIPIMVPTFNPSFNPSSVPSISPLTPRPTYDWEHIDDNMAEIKLDQMVNQSCLWRELQCGHCLEILRITQETVSRTDQLLDQYDEEDQCKCFGGIGTEQTTENNRTVLTIHTQNNISTLTFEVNEDDDDPDDITLSIAYWAYSGNNSIGVEYDMCELEFYVNRNSFLGINARSILKVEFDITTIKDINALTMALIKYFNNNITLQMDEHYIAVCVIIFTESAEDARQAKSNLEASQVSIELNNIIHNKTGENANVEHIKYSLLSRYELKLDDVDDTEHNDDEEEDTEAETEQVSTKLVIGGTVLVIIIFSSILVSILIITWVVYTHCKDKKKMDYQKPEVTRDNISEIHETSDCECQQEGEMEENHAILPFDGEFAPATGFNVSRRIDLNVSRRIKTGINLDALDDEEENDDLVLHPGGMTPYDSSNNVLCGIATDELRSEMADTVSSFSAKTSLINFDLDSNMDIDELVPSMIDKVCGSNKTRLIHHNELWIQHIIGKGHYGEVYVAKYDGNTVAIKTFPDLDIDQQNDNGTYDEDDEKADSPLMGGYNTLHKSFKKGYSSIDKEDEDIVAFNNRNGLDINLRKKIYGRTKEVYSEVVLASSLPLHPNLVQIIGITQNPLKIVMTYYESGNLMNYIYLEKRKQLITLNSIMNLMQKISDGILFLHNNKIVHRDIAARNVLLGHIDSDGQIKENTTVVISDFGMTRCMTHNYDESMVDPQQTKQNIGPLKWMAPESISQHKYSYKSDVYMLGITMFEIMHGREPYTSMRYNKLTLPILAIKIVKKSIRPIIDEIQETESITHSNKTVILKINKLMTNCWQKSPQTRPSVLSILHDLNSIYDSMLGL